MPLTDDLDTAMLLLRFRDFLKGLGTQPITITLSSVVKDMMHHYASIRHTLTDHFSWETCGDLTRTLEEFCLTRECWFYPSQKEAALEVTFHVSGSQRRPVHAQIGLGMHYTWAAPVVSFQDLSNVATEDREFKLKPCIGSTRPFSAMSDVSIEYYAGPSRDWLHWDSHQKCFRGRVPPVIASMSGVERQSTYTIPLELTATVTKCFAGGIRHECVIRCALPLTVKRRPDACWTEAKYSTLPSPLKSLLGRKRCEIPIPLPGTSTVEVRMVRDMQLNASPATEHIPPRRRPRMPMSPEFWALPSSSERQTGESMSRRSSPSTVMRTPSHRYASLVCSFGPTHVNRRGELDDNSDEGTDLDTPQALDIMVSPIRKSAHKGDPRATGDGWHTTTPIRLKKSAYDRNEFRSPCPARSVASCKGSDRATLSHWENKWEKPFEDSLSTKRKHNERTSSNMNNDLCLRPGSRTSNRKNYKRQMAASTSEDTGSPSTMAWDDGDKHKKPKPTRSASVHHSHSPTPDERTAEEVHIEHSQRVTLQGQKKGLTLVSSEKRFQHERETLAPRSSDACGEVSAATEEDPQIRIPVVNCSPGNGEHAENGRKLKAIEDEIQKLAKEARTLRSQASSPGHSIMNGVSQHYLDLMKAGYEKSVYADDEEEPQFSPTPPSRGESSVEISKADEVSKCSCSKPMEPSRSTGSATAYSSPRSRHDSFTNAYVHRNEQRTDDTGTLAPGSDKATKRWQREIQPNYAEVTLEASAGDDEYAESIGAARPTRDNVVVCAHLPRPEGVVRAHDAMLSASEEEVNVAERWQREIQDNYSEFAHKKWMKEGEDVTMLDASVLEASWADLEEESD